jgi:hypothetical protein
MTSRHIASLVIENIVHDVVSASALMQSTSDPLLALHSPSATHSVHPTLFFSDPSAAPPLVDHLSDTQQCTQQFQPRILQQSDFLSGACGYLALHSLIILLHAKHARDSGDESRAACLHRALTSPAAFWSSLFAMKRALGVHESIELGSLWHRDELGSLELHRDYISVLFLEHVPIVRLREARVAEFHMASWLSRREIEAGVQTASDEERLSAQLCDVSRQGGSRAFLVGAADHWCGVIVTRAPAHTAHEDQRNEQRPQSTSLESSTSSRDSELDSQPVPDAFVADSPVSCIPRSITRLRDCSALCSADSEHETPLVITQSSISRSRNLEIVMVESNNFATLTGNHDTLWARACDEVAKHEMHYRDHVRKSFAAFCTDAELAHGMQHGRPYPHRIYSLAERRRRLFFRMVDTRCALSLIDSVLAYFDADADDAGTRAPCARTVGASVGACCAAVVASRIISTTFSGPDGSAAANDLIAAAAELQREIVPRPAEHLSGFTLALLGAWSRHLDDDATTNAVDQCGLAAVRAAVCDVAAKCERST